MTLIHKDLHHVGLNEDANRHCPSGGNTRVQLSSDFTPRVEDANPVLLYDNFSQRGNPHAHCVGGRRHLRDGVLVAGRGGDRR